MLAELDAAAGERPRSGIWGLGSHPGQQHSTIRPRAKRVSAQLGRTPLDFHAATVLRRLALADLSRTA